MFCIICVLAPKSPSSLRQDPPTPSTVVEPYINIMKLVYFLSFSLSLSTPPLAPSPNIRKKCCDTPLSTNTLRHQPPPQSDTPPRTPNFFSYIFI